MRQRLARNADAAGLPRLPLAGTAALRLHARRQSCLWTGASRTHIVPLAAERRERRRRRLGLDALRPWDLVVDPLSQPPLRPFATADELEEGAARIFDRLDPELGAEYARLRGGFLDLGSRRNKAPGGYCSFFPQTGLAVHLHERRRHA